MSGRDIDGRGLEGREMSEYADFRALRETLGFTRENVADACGVSVHSVKRWENPKESKMPPEDAWNLLRDAEEDRKMVMEKALSVVAEVGGDAVQLTYWRSQEQYDSLGGGDGFYGVANANARAVAECLKDEGVLVEWSYPDDGDNLCREND